MKDHPVAPFSSGASQPRTAVPFDACDCHMHVFDSRRAPVAGAVLSPPTATIDDYAKLQARLGTRRHVLVQPSTYGTDNSLMIAALRSRGGVARGVAVVDTTVRDQELCAMGEAGVVGVRFNQVQAGATSMSMLNDVAARVAEMGWHMQFHLTGQQLADNVQALSRLNVPIVLDHYARLHHLAAVADDARRALWQLLDTGKVWLKLSAPYLSSQTESPPYPDLNKATAALVAEFPHRLVWGTDWPHATETYKPDDAALLDWFSAAVSDSQIRHKILVDNAAELYQFPARDSV